MADQYAKEGSSSSNVSGENSESIVDLNIKTLDSQLYNFKVDKNMSVSAFKEKIANEIGVPVGQQRLIFRGRVLKDDHPLSEYHVENGHTLHLVERQPAQSQSPSDTNSGETHGNNGNRGNDPSTGVPRNRLGQISHSVVLGTFNVGDQGEGSVPDLSRVIGAVLNSFGIGGQTASNAPSGTQSSTSSPTLNSLGQVQQGNETDGMRGGVGGHVLPGNQAQFQFGQPIPDALNTLLEFMMRMEQALSQIGNQSIPSSTSAEELPRLELPSNGRGLASPESLSIVLRHAQRLLSGPSINALSHIAGRLEQDGASSDPAIRGQIQTESGTLGLAMQHLGALFLELGRAILMLRMGHSPEEFSVNAGPAVYISSLGPNPIMVQPFPLQTNSLFGSSGSPANPSNVGPLGIGNAPRHINIHIHAGTALAPVVHAVGARLGNGEGTQGERGNGTGSGGSGPMRVLPVRNVIATAVPSRSTGVAVPNTLQAGVGSVSPPAPDTVSLSSFLAEVDSRVGNYISAMQGENRVASVNDMGNEHPNNTTVNEARQTGVAPSPCEDDGRTRQPESLRVGNSEAMGSLFKVEDLPTGSLEDSVTCSREDTTVESETSENAPSSSEKRDLQPDAKAAPLGLGLGGLERKRRSKQPKQVVKAGDSGTDSSPPGTNTITATSGSLSAGVNRNMECRSSIGQGSHGQFDTAGAMSQILQSPALDGLLSGVSEQTGVGSPDVLRNMLQQLTQSPQIMSTVNQIAQQVDGQDIGNMFSGLGNGQGGGIDLSRMMQHMMPVVSRALSHGSAAPQPFPSMEPEPQQVSNMVSLRGAGKSGDQNIEVNVEGVAQMVQGSSRALDVFHAVAENAVRLYADGSSSDDLVGELCSSEDLANDYLEMLRRDLNRRLQGDSGQDKH
ncbi:large proline-rich protein BAG6 isoform X2 [Tripterygium wilfordii]|uniref:Large proline-rich protein BAG6 isoform X2 n=1 Tax=Tripterygium wilfordii TaxID=458696 RepID=A0A7J7D3L5_TRIWF|nr:large proline-rich protein BAG6 [Tripterygium wilfordii]KAF5740922.1 large proline-rich protein BAG6 isoform X2 [Tripterygium wilfordii]